MSYADYLANRKKVSVDLSEKFQSVEDKKQVPEKKAKDDRLWYPELDETTKTGAAVIRFLPGLDPSKPPFIEWYEHRFNNPTDQSKWLHVTCLGSRGRGANGHKCPICEHNKILYKGTPAERELYDGQRNDKGMVVNSRKCKHFFMTNVLVIRDPANPENEGKVKLFRFGPDIHKKLVEVGKGQPLLKKKGIDFVDMMDGADFNFIIGRKDKRANYDTCSFENVSPIYGGDEKKQAEVFEAQHDLAEYFEKSLYWQTYEQIQKRLDIVNGVATTESKTSTKSTEKASDAPSTPNAEPPKVEQPKVEQKKQSPPPPPPPPSTDGTVLDDEEEFKRLAGGQ